VQVVVVRCGVARRAHRRTGLLASRRQR
jgi:hypothetical protein